MLQYKCLIIEDEPLAAEVLQDYIKQVPFLSLSATCKDAIFAMEYLRKEEVDLIFLDIHLPKLKGLDFLNTLKNPPFVIITSAYHEYALKSYDYSITDYLLKPIEFARFLTAVSKIRNIGTSKKDPIVIQEEKRSIFFSVNKKKVKILLDEVLYIESIREYVRIVTTNKTIITKLPLVQIEVMLSNRNFIKVHRSFIVAKNKIDAFSSTDVDISGKQIPIGRNFKETVISAFGSSEI